MKTIVRMFVIKCRSNNGGKHLIPVEIKETVPSSDPAMGYDVVSSSPYFGEIREPLTKRGDLVKTKAGEDRITRTPHVGKTVNRGRNGFTFVHVHVPVPEYVMFTKRTDEPKLGWLMAECRKAGLRVKLHGNSWHAPMSWVHRDDQKAAWEILAPVDNLPDDDPRFQGHQTRLPENCEIEDFGDGTFRLMFNTETSVYDSEIYGTTAGETVEEAALAICHRFDWINNPPK